MPITISLSINLCAKRGSPPIIAEALDRRRSHLHDMGVTGAMLLAGRHVVEVLEIANASEGSSRVRVDMPPHCTRLRIDRWAIGRRRFPAWRAADAGHSQFVVGHVSRMLAAASPLERRRAADRLTDLVFEFARSTETTPGPS